MYAKRKTQGELEVMSITAPLHNSPHKFKIFMILCCIVLVSGCNANKQTSLRDGYLGDIGERMKSEFLSQSPFDQDSMGVSREKILSNNLFELASVQSGSIYQRLNKVAQTQIGRYYHSGGAEPATGFDCSGFTSWVYGRIGVNLPRSSREQFMEGKAVAKNELRKGDLVFFARKKRISHVGIYLENGEFIHSTRPGDTVKISNLSEPIWEKQYVGGRRVL